MRDVGGDRARRGHQQHDQQYPAGRAVAGLLRRSPAARWSADASQLRARLHRRMSDAAHRPGSLGLRADEIARPSASATHWPSLLRGGAAVFGLVFGAALVAFIAARPSVEARFPRRLQHPADLHNLASFEYGPVVVASSYDTANHHHPAFLVDRRPHPTRLEKWVSDPADRRPWIEIMWGEPHDLVELVVVQGAAYESILRLTRRALVSCLRQGSTFEARTIDDLAPVTRVALPCQAASGVRLDFSVRGGTDLVRLYEVEAWGR